MISVPYTHSHTHTHLILRLPACTSLSSSHRDGQFSGSYCSRPLTISSPAATIAGLGEKLGVGRETVFLCLLMELRDFAASHDRRQYHAESGHHMCRVPWDDVHVHHVHALRRLTLACCCREVKSGNGTWQSQIPPKSGTCAGM